MKSTIFIVLIFLAVIFFSCTSKKSKINLSNIVDISKDQIPTTDKYDKLFRNLEIIKLETTSKSLIGRITKILYKNNRYYIFDRNSKAIFIFNSNGRFINKLYRLGKGPKEYPDIRDFDIDADNNILVLSNNKILIYNSNLSYVKEIGINIKDENNYPFPTVLFSKHDKNYYLFRGSFGLTNFKSNNIYSLYCIDDQSNIISKSFPISFKFPFTHQTFYKSNDIINITETFGNDTIYSINENKIQPKIKIDFGNKSIDSYSMKNQRDKMYELIKNQNLMGGIQKVYETSDYMSFVFSIAHEKKQAILKKGTNQVKLINLTETSTPFPWIVINGAQEDCFISFVEPYMLMNYTLKNNKLFSESKILETLDENDNPVIFKYKIEF